jgi:nitrogenase molybdenum-iron protein alpha/beta subunit
VVRYPIADALPVVHGPIGCAVYNWDVRGALSSGPQLHRNRFATDRQEIAVIYGGEKKFRQSLCELIDPHRPLAAFVYSTCIVGVIDDFNIAGESWLIRRDFAEMGVQVVATITGDRRVDDLRRCHLPRRAIGEDVPHILDGFGRGERVGDHERRGRVA